MIPQGLLEAKQKRKLSVRQISVKLGYKNSTVLHHMVSGRAPIPIDRAEELAEALELEFSEFLRAVVYQRHPEVDWNLLMLDCAPSAKIPVEEALDAVFSADPTMTRSQRLVLKDIVQNRATPKRWISQNELKVLELIRSLRPDAASEGLSVSDREKIEAALM
jgi:cyanate lyase